MIISIITILPGCIDKGDKESEIINSSVKIIKPELEHVSFDIKDILDSVKFIKLELTKNSIVGSINRVVVFEDRIYVLDNVSNSIFNFNMEGKFLSKISKVGRGPGEYIQVDFFDIDFENRQIVLTDLMSYRILRYSLDGDFISENKIPFWIEGMTPTFNKGTVLFANFRNNKGKLDQEYNVIWLDSLMNISKTFFPYNSRNFSNPTIKFSTPESGVFYNFNQNRYFFSPHKTTIYKITDEEMKPEYIFDFGDESFNEDYLNQNTTLKTYMEQGDFYKLSNVLENNEFVIFSFFKESNRVIQSGYYSKRSNNVINSVTFTVDGNSYFSFNNISTYNSWIIAKIHPSELISWSEYIAGNKKPLNNEFLVERTNIAKDIGLNDNHVLMFYKLKQF